MPDEILGNFVLNLQGLIHARSVVNLKALGQSTIRAGLGGHVDLTKTGWSPMDPVTGKARTADCPALTAFYPTPDPEPAAPAYVANVGFYPYAEIGVLTFQGEGKVDGTLKVNVGGFTGEGQAASVSGGYHFDDETGISGVISLQFFENHVWDYFFVRVSPNELSVIAGDRLPRPATAAGTLRRMEHME